MKKYNLPLPAYFDQSKVGQLWSVPYQQRAEQARQWAKHYNLQPAKDDKDKICLFLIDVQNTFCIPESELFVGGRSGRGAVEDNIRLCQFIYRHLDVITDIYVTLDTHLAMQIFHPIFWVDQDGNHPQPLTPISRQDIEQGKWQINPRIISQLSAGNPDYLKRYVLHYTGELEKAGRFQLMIWPYHAMKGSVGHALVPAVEEALFFHSIARHSQTVFINKGEHPLTENYSIFAPEVLEDFDGQPVGKRNWQLFEKLIGYDRVIIAGQAKSHCVAWTVADLLAMIKKEDEKLAGKFYLLEDCTSPVVVPGVVDFSEVADEVFAEFAQAGMHVIKSTDSLDI